jgi:hypothetical protein
VFWGRLMSAMRVTILCRSMALQHGIYMLTRQVAWG